MSDHRHRFLQLALTADALRFGQFTLKSGRLSPYFFNAGRFDSGSLLSQLGACYADAIDATGIKYDVVFGPAYKGIPLATAMACELAQRGRDLPLSFNRKEAKDHGEGGQLIGADLNGKRVLIVDDVITAGTAIREALGIIRAAGGTPAGIVVEAEQGAHGPAALGPHFVDLGRVAQPEEQATAIVFLASDAASNINGAILPADDGWAAV